MIRRLGIAVAALSCLAATPAFAQAAHLVVITGVEAGPEYRQQFHQWASAVIDAASKGGVPAANVVYLAEQGDRDPRVTGRSTKDGIERAFDTLAAAVQPSDSVFIVLFGHGSYDGQRAALNLPGPDLTAADWARLLGRLKDQRVVFVNTASSSGAFLEPLATPGRVIVTATKTGGERNETRFPAYFVEALTSPEADQNHDGRVSVLEAFQYAKTQVEDAYKKEGLLLTEHAALEDGGGVLAATLALGASGGAAADADAAASDPQMRALLEERHALEQQVDALKLRKASMPEADYEAQLEKLLTALALKSREIEQAKAKK
ncbi:MAG: C13 family peptidase [Betaproteobacteria bacterium]